MVWKQMLHGIIEFKSVPLFLLFLFCWCFCCSCFLFIYKTIVRQYGAITLYNVYQRESACSTERFSMGHTGRFTTLTYVRSHRGKVTTWYLKQSTVYFCIKLERNLVVNTNDIKQTSVKWKLVTSGFIDNDQIIKY